MIFRALNLLPDALDNGQKGIKYLDLICLFDTLTCGVRIVDQSPRTGKVQVTVLRNPILAYSVGLRLDA